MIKDSKLLSITIPTWNRASTLNQSLNYLLPQIEPYKQFIELIICDNCSDDNTKLIIDKHFEKFKKIDKVIYNQKKNTGFYGNFKKCKELSNGEFIWMLSDDDFIKPHVISQIIKILLKYKNKISILYLDSKTKKNQPFNHYSIDIESLFLNFNINLTLISSIIFYNIKENDTFIFSKFYNSHLIGFCLVIDIKKIRNYCIVLNGSLLSYRMDIIKGYNIFDAFIFDLNNILNYMYSIGYSKKIIYKFKSNLIKYTWCKRYYYLKATGKLDGKLKTYNLKKVDYLFWKYYKKNINYWLYIYPIKVMPVFIIKYSFPLVEKIRNKIKND